LIIETFNNSDVGTYELEFFVEFRTLLNSTAKIYVKVIEGDEKPFYNKSLLDYFSPVFQ